MLIIEVDFSALLGPHECLALRSSAARRVRDSQKCEDRSEDNGGVPRALGLPNGVLARFGLVVPDSRHDQICAVDSDHTGLNQTGSRVVLLNDGVDAHHRDDDAEDHIEGDEESVESAPLSSEETVKDTGEGDRGGIHSGCRTDYDPLPQIRTRCLPVLET